MRDGLFLSGPPYESVTQVPRHRVLLLFWHSGMAWSELRMRIFYMGWVFFFFFRALFRMVLMRFFETWFGSSCASFGPKTSSSRHTHMCTALVIWVQVVVPILRTSSWRKKNWILWNILIEIWAWNAASCVWYAGKISKFLLSAARLQLLIGVIWYQSVSL